MRRALVLLLAAVAFVLCAGAGCGAESGLDPAGDGGSRGVGVSGCGSCKDNVYAVCDAKGAVTERRDCGTKVCIADRGCLDCAPGMNACEGNVVRSCGSDGRFGAVVETCDVGGGQRCSDGRCKSSCELEAGTPSNVGCEFWPVHLPNSWGDTSIPGTGLNFGTTGANADYAPWGVVLANAGDHDANVTIEVSDAAYGQPAQPRVLTTFRLRPNELRRELLPTRVIDGGLNAQHVPVPPGTALSANAFRITSTSPLVAYQFNTAEQQFSNDASLLLPASVLGTEHRVISYGAANPMQLAIPGAPTFEGIPDHGYVSIVGTRPNTHVTVVVGAKTQPGSGIPITPKGSMVHAVLGPFEVLNLQTHTEDFNDLIANGAPDMTGTVVVSDYPVAVYTGTQRSVVAKDRPGGPGTTEGHSVCCTDHLEDPVLPMASLGKEFAVAHSPYRNGVAPREPDLVRILGAASATSVTTNLPAPDDHFTLAPGQLKEIWATEDFAMVATEPLYVSQLLVSQSECGRTIGDPALTGVVPVAQFRSDYLFLMPTSWSENYVVLTVPEGSEGSILVDGAPLPASCSSAPIGPVGGTNYRAFRCPFAEGPHKAQGAQPFGLMAYGYGPAGSYALTAGANLRPIYVPPRLL